MPDIGEIVLQRGRAGDVRAGFDLRDFLAVGGRDYVKKSVASAERDLAAADGGRAVDVVLRLDGPERFAGGRINAVQVRVIAADEYPQRAAVRAKPIRAAHDFVAGRVFPLERAARGVECVEIR